MALMDHEQTCQQHVIGAFVVGALGLAVATILVVGGSRFSRRSNDTRCSSEVRPKA